MSASTGQTNLAKLISELGLSVDILINKQALTQEIDSEARARRDYAGHVPIANRGVTTQLH
ncbi:hypothetical protein [Paenibacillus sp. 7516]|uniref:hypothetical protein n=1 Tax=Paenibacillus sp. 7516 TaxID=2022549 RepID=UPI000BA5A24C|nr:hypothetical protein [Paenibacillus sp. 7516]PAF31007.1 hypothetical protein CHI14_14780 [Paenibacillus sp. 7516]